MNDKDKTSGRTAEKGVFHAPWEKSFDKILTPFEEFIHRTTGGLLLMATAILVT